MCLTFIRLKVYAMSMPRALAHSYGQQGPKGTTAHLLRSALPSELKPKAYNPKSYFGSQGVGVSA